MLSVPLRTLRRKFNIQTDDPSVAAAFAFMKTDPEIEGPGPEQIDLPIGTNFGFQTLRLPSGNTIEGSTNYLLSELRRMHFRCSIDEYPYAALVCCGTITLFDQHLIFIGHKDVGQSTLLLHLAALGWPVTGDGQLILEGLNAIPRPRRLRVKAGMLAYLPEWAADIVRTSPFVTNWDGSRTFAVEPSAFGHRWILRSCPVRNIILLRGNHGGRSRIRPWDWQSTLEQILKNTFLPEANKMRTLADLRALVISANCLELWNGRVEDSHRLLYEIFGAGE